MITKSIKQFAIGVATLVLALGMVFAFTPSVQALTQAEADAIILALGLSGSQADVINGLVTGGGSSSTSCTVYGLSGGASGIQMAVNQVGYSPALTVDGAIGPMSRAGIQWAQGQIGTIADGLWGNNTQMAYETWLSNNCSTGSTGSTGGSSSTGELSCSGVGSVEEYKRDSGYSSEEVGEDTEDVVVAALEIEADTGSDLEITALKIDFDDEGTSNNEADLDKYVEDVSVWFDGDEYARVDASRFDDDNSYGRTVSLDDGLIVEAGERITVMIAVSGISNLDSSSAGDSWQVDIETVRWRDCSGSTISESITFAETTFTVENFATSADTEFKIKSNGDDINDAQIFNVDATNATDNVKVFSFDVEIKGDADVMLDDITMEATVTGAGYIDEMFDQAHLYVDGEKVDSVTTPTDDDTLTFDDLDLDLEGGETYTFDLYVDFFAISGALDEGDTLSWTIGETQTDLGTAYMDVRDANGDQLVDADKTGSASSQASATHDVFIEVELVSTPTAEVLSDGNGGNDDDTITFTFVMDITAVDGTVYVGDTAAATTSADGSLTTVGADAVVYRVYEDGTATADATDVTTYTTSDGNVSVASGRLVIGEGGTTRYTVTITHTNVVTADDGIYYADIAGIGWSIGADDIHEYVYTYDLDDYETPAKYVD